jgi:sulfatase maturation enzyme AslB (radical SAM superfamily)
MFYAKEFADEFSSCASGKKLSVVTTLHSHNPEKHEMANQTNGSFNRTIQGLKNLIENEVHVTVKHCITKENYTDLPMFYQYICSTFPETADIQLCSIDYCSLDKNQAKDQMVSFLDIAESLEEMFDAYIEDLNKGSHRNLYGINLPLCSCDPYYWEFIAPRLQNYTSYASPDSNGEAVLISAVDDNVGTFFNECRDCKAKPVCSGTYKSAFENFGDKIVKKYVE